MMKYKLFGKSGLRVSEICLGTMTFGTEWGWGADFETSKKIFDIYEQAGGNFIDTANRYTEGTSEKFIGEFIKPNREHYVLATKYSLYDKRDDPNFSGNHRKNMMRSVNESLKRLKTDYLDILWLHAWDFTTPIEEVMRGLNDLVTQGKVHYLGISDTPSWVVATANTLAQLRGYTPLTGLQIEYSLLQRTPERELIPMANYFDMAITPWAPLAGGALTGKYLANKQAGRLKPESKRLSETSMKIAQEVVNIANELQVSASAVAINWVRSRSKNIIPIIGARKPEQMTDSLTCLNFILPNEQLERLNHLSEIELGFPHDFLNQDGIKDVLFGGTYNQIDLGNFSL